MSIRLSKALQDTPLREGHLPAYTGPGSYPLFYVVRDEYGCEGCWCAKCANTVEDAVSVVTSTGVNYEDPDLYCDQCEERIESAYAEEDAESE